MMSSFDRYAWTNAIHDLDPLPKASLTLVAIALCLLLNRWTVSLITLFWMAAMTTLWARIPLRVVLQTILAEALFLSISTLGIALGVGNNPPEMSTVVAGQIGGIWFFSSPAMLERAATLLLRALGCATAMSFLALTTPMVALIDLLRRLRVPELLIDLMIVGYRSIFVLLDTLERIYIAQESRLGYGSAKRIFVSAANLGSRIFVEGYLRSQQLVTALESRGYGGGDFLVLPTPYQPSRWAWGFTVLLALTLLLFAAIT